MAPAVQASAHWERVYRSKAPESVSWYESQPSASLRLIDSLGLDPSAPILDAGGGASHLAARLVERGFADVTVADASPAALEVAGAVLGDAADRVAWVVADLRTEDLGREFDLRHERAVFHFQVDPGDREAYLVNLRRSIAPSGFVVIATFGPEGPTTCSDLPVHRYGADELAAALGPEFELQTDELVNHRTPAGPEQQFLYAVFRRR
jgi:SAM-dependent methyltransferase